MVKALSGFLQAEFCTGAEYSCVGSGGRGLLGSDEINQGSPKLPLPGQGPASMSGMDLHFPLLPDLPSNFFINWEYLW